LLDWLRAEAAQPCTQPMDDRADQVALQWLLGEVQQHADPRLLDAVEQLLTEGNPVVSTRLLEIAAVAPPHYRSAVARALARAPSAFAARSESQTRSLRGHAITALAAGPFADTPPPTLADVLELSTTPADGAPSSLILGLKLAPARFVPLLGEAVPALNDWDLGGVVTSLVNAVDAGVVDQLLAAIGQAADLAHRQRVYAALERAIAERAEVGAFLKAQGRSQPPGASAADLPRYRATLAV
jgi:hypothetical protein